MRDILFRAKSGQTWYYGGVHREKFYHGSIESNNYRYRWCIITDEEDEYRVRPDTICQYTGLNDIKGNQIFENDIVRIGVHINGTFFEDNYICKYDDNKASFRFQYIVPQDIEQVKHYAVIGENIPMSDIETGYVMEIMGNIFDNPELLNNIKG